MSPQCFTLGRWTDVRQSTCPQAPQKLNRRLSLEKAVHAEYSRVLVQSHCLYSRWVL
jgi:hypothetical protein